MTLTPIGGTEQRGASIALAALQRDTEGLAVLLDLTDDQDVRAATAVALGALAELALTARPHNITKTRDALRNIHARGPRPAL
jgi:predicted DNA-binding protein with PD1-like motif